MSGTLSSLRTKPGDSGDRAPPAESRQIRPVNAGAAVERSEAPTARLSDAEAPAGTAPAKSGSRRKPLLMGIGALALMGVAYFAYQYITVGRFLVSTDDAYVGAYMSIISPKIPAIVAEVPIVDNEAVKAGQTLVKLDDGDYRLTLEQAQSKLAT